MNQNTNQKGVIAGNKAFCIDGFDPASLVEEFTDKKSNEFHIATARVAWFRLIYPEGKISLEVEENQEKQECMATARIYTKFDAPEDHYIAKATCKQQPDSGAVLSPLESAQTNAVSMALMNAGFIIPDVSDESAQIPTVGKQDAGQTPAPAQTTNQTKNQSGNAETVKTATAPQAQAQQPAPQAQAQPAPDYSNMTYEDACKVPCPLHTNKGVPLGQLVALEPGAVSYLARSSFNEKVKKAAQIICNKAGIAYQTGTESAAV